MVVAGRFGGGKSSGGNLWGDIFDVCRGQRAKVGIVIGLDGEFEVVGMVWWNGLGRGKGDHGVGTGWRVGRGGKMVG